PVPQVACPAMLDWTREDYDGAWASVQELAAKIKDLGVPARHPFSGCGLVELMPGEVEKIGAALEALLAAGRSAREAASTVPPALGLPAPADAAALDAAAALAALALEAPDLRGLPPVGQAWDRPEALKALTDCAERGIRRDGLLKAEA